MNDDDAELVAQIRKDAQDAFSELVRRHQSRVFAILYRYERDPQRLEDLAQQTFLKVWRSLDGFTGRAPFEHWLSRIAARVALDHLRQLKRRPQTIPLSELGDDSLEWLQSDEGRNEPGSRQAAELLELAMRELSPAQRVVITMQELEGYSVKEICERTGSSSVAVRVRAMRARAKLKKALKELRDR